MSDETRCFFYALIIFYGTLSYSGSQRPELHDNLLYHVDYSTDYQCTYDKGKVDEIRRKYTNLRTEYMGNKENWTLLLLHWNVLRLLLKE